MREVLVLVGIGIAVGLPAAFAVTRFASSQLYGVSANDPLAMVSATALLAAVALLAGYIQPKGRRFRPRPRPAVRVGPASWPVHAPKAREMWGQPFRAAAGLLPISAKIRPKAHFAVAFLPPSFVGVEC